MTPSEVSQLMDRFARAWDDHDLDGAMACVAPDCELETAAPAPDGTTVRGRDAIRREWEPYFRPTFRFEREEELQVGETVVHRWRLMWPYGTLRGIDVIRVHDGAITAKLTYVKT